MDRTAERARVVVEEIEAVDLGDARLNHRARKVVRAIASQPTLGFPQALATEAELEGFYRLLSNDKVTPQRLLAPHVEATIERLAHRKIRLLSTTRRSSDSAAFRAVKGSQKSARPDAGFKHISHLR